jgi:hypothetical protein
MDKSCAADGTVIVKDGVEISMPPLDRNSRLEMERCAEFMARMIEKYGREVMEDIRASES